MIALGWPQSAGPVFILNGHSFYVGEVEAHIARVSDGFGIAAQVIVTKRGDDIASLAAEAITAKRAPIVAGGGDGTVNAVAGKLAGTDTVLGVLPMGTLNHFARDVGVPRSLEAAVRNVFTGKIAEVDVGEVNGRVFVNNSGIGFYPHFVRVPGRTGAARPPEAGRIHVGAAFARQALLSPTHQCPHGRSASTRTPDPVPVRRQQPISN